MVARHRQFPARGPSARTLRRAGRARPHKRLSNTSGRLKTANRKALLLGTALASTIVLGSFAMPAPALAQTYTFEQTLPFSDDAFNDAKIVVTLDATVVNNGLTVGFNYNYTSTDETPLAELTLIERYTVTNDVMVINTGDIDPLIGINALIENIDVLLARAAGQRQLDRLWPHLSL